MHKNQSAVPNIISGSIQLDHLKKIFALMPQDIKEQAEIAYSDIVSKDKSDFHYAELNEIFNGGVH